MFAARKLLTTIATATATKSNVSFRPAATPSTSISRRDFTTTINAKYIPELAVHLARKILLDRMPYTLCLTENREQVLEAITLSIPGIAEKKETNEKGAFKVFLDLKAANESDISSSSVDVDNKRNAVFFEAQVKPEDDSCSSRYYYNRVNLRKNSIYDDIDIDNQDGGVLVTLREYVPPFLRRKYESNL